jgi:hypothetical protein
MFQPGERERVVAEAGERGRKRKRKSWTKIVKRRCFGVMAGEVSGYYGIILHQVGQVVLLVVLLVEVEEVVEVLVESALLGILEE